MRTGRAPLANKPTSCRFGPFANSSRMISAPGKSAASRRFFERANLSPAMVGVAKSAETSLENKAENEENNAATDNHAADNNDAGSE